MLFKHHRFLPNLIGFAACLYFRFPLGLRIVERTPAAWGFELRYESPGRRFTPVHIRARNANCYCAESTLVREGHPAPL